MTDGSCPPRLAAALRDAVFPGGGRVRPRLCLAIADAIVPGRGHRALRSAVALELLHCASLVHDDLPCFDDADTRRGLPTVHRAYGEPIALLVGDGLIAHAFGELGRGPIADPSHLAGLLMELTRAAGAPRGIVAGQAWESEPRVDLAAYHRAKTGALFEAACAMGALSVGVDPDPWRRVGARLGEAYQVADDLADLCADERDTGKTSQRDAQLDRPSAAHLLGPEGAAERLFDLLDASVQAVPPCPGQSHLIDLIRTLGTRLCPPSLTPRSEERVEEPRA